MTSSTARKYGSSVPTGFSRKDSFLSVACLFGNDVDNTVHCIRSPKGRAGTSDDFNAVDIFQQRVLHIPVHAGKQRCIDTPAVNQHEELVREAAVESPR